MKKLKIKLVHWDNTCGDGCCTTYGTDLFIDDKEIEGDYSSVDGEQLKSILEHIGYEIELEEVQDFQ